MSLAFQTWVKNNLQSLGDRGAELGELGFVLARLINRPLEDVYLEFEADIDEFLEGIALEMDQESVMGYTRSVFGVEEFESIQDFRLKTLELAVYHALRTPLP